MYSRKVVDYTRDRLEKALGYDLRDYSLQEVNDFAYQYRDVEWPEGQISQVLQGLPEEYQRYVVNELNLCTIDFRYWATRYCYILSDDKRQIPMATLWPSQERLLSTVAEEEERQWLKGLPPKVKIALLKSRQIGGTVLSEALAAHMTFLQPKTQSVIGSDHPDNTLKLWQTLLRMYDGLPPWMRPVRDAKPKAQNLHFPELDSDIVYGSGNQKTTLGQGMTIDFAHISEVSTWLYPGYLDEDLMWAFDSSQKHHTLLVLESTAAGGMGNWFHDVYKAAEAGKNDFKSVFIAWYDRPTWKSDPEGVTLDKETIKLSERLKENGRELSKAQLAFWQKKRVAAEAEFKLEIFYQEFPSFPDEAFQSGFKAAVPLEIRASLRRKTKKPLDVYQFNPDSKKLKQIDSEIWWRSVEPEKWDHKLLVWERKKPSQTYVVGVDASHGIEGGDSAAIEVLRVGDRLRPDEQVAEFCGNISPLVLADVSEVVGRVFADYEGYPAKLAIEVNPGSPGIVTQTELIRRGYPHFFRWRRPLRTDGRVSVEVGWWTTPGTRPLLTERGVEALIKDQIWINSSEFVKELDTYVNTGLDRERGVNRKFLEAAPGYHDDRIMALFIALEVAHADDQYNMAVERKKFWEQKTAPAPESQQFQMILKPWDQLMAEWEDSVVDRIT